MTPSESAAGAPPVVTLETLVEGFGRSGLRAGSVVLVHSALRTLGHVDGGAGAVRDALLQVVGLSGTLVAPTFTFVHEIEDEPTIDPARDPSEMGAITEAVRMQAGALRSTAYRHSFAAIGPSAEAITQVDPRRAPFDRESSFGAMLRLDAQVMLIGVPYSNSTSHHFAEWLCEVPYRHTVPRKVQVRQVDGSLTPMTMIDFQPRPSLDGSYYGSRGTDFNKLGKMLEERGQVGIVTIGNALVRRFAMRDLVDLARSEAAIDYNVFRTPDGQPDFMTPLADGQIVESDEVVDGAGRPDHHHWSVVSPQGLFRRPG